MDGHSSASNGPRESAADTLCIMRSAIVPARNSSEKRHPQYEYRGYGRLDTTTMRGVDKQTHWETSWGVETNDSKHVR